MNDTPSDHLVVPTTLAAEGPPAHGALQGAHIRASVIAHLVPSDPLDRGLVGYWVPLGVSGGES